MDPVVILLLALFLGIPLLSLIVMFAFAATADFEPKGIEVRGGSIRGAIAGAIAKIVVGDAKTFQLPLVVELRKIGILGTSTLLIGGATVRDIEWRIFLDGEHVSTVTEASSVHIGSRQEVLHLPVNAEVHLPRGLLGTWRKYRQDRRMGREVRLEVRGHVIVKHWFMTREVPVRVTRHVVIGEPVPEARLRWSSEGPEPAAAALLDLHLQNPYREEPLDGDLSIAVVHHRRMRRDPVLASHEETVRLEPGARRRWRFQVTLPRPVEGEAPVVQDVWIRIQWQGEDLEPLPGLALQGPDEPEVPHRTVRMVTSAADLRTARMRRS